MEERELFRIRACSSPTSPVKGVVALRTVGVCIFLVNSVACEPPPRASEATAASQEAIQGGQVEAGYPAVGGLGNSIDDDGFGCTGTLIAPTLVLSAKHCGALSIFRLGPSWSEHTTERLIDRQFPYHPEESVGPDEFPLHDLQVYELDSPIYDVRPLPINTGPLPANGTSCIAVGFGDNATGGFGTKYSATVTVSSTGSVGSLGQVDLASAIKIAAGSPTASPPGGTLDYGDSGGPLLCNGVIMGVVTGAITGGSNPGQYYTALDSTLTNGSSWVTNVASNYVNEPMVSAVSWSSNHFDAFARGTNGAVYHKTFDSTWAPASDGTHWYPSQSDWEYLGGFITGTPEAIARAPGFLDVFVRGGDSSPQTDDASTMGLYHLYWNGSTWIWQNLGGVLISHPAVVSWAPNRIDIFGISWDGVLYHNSGEGSGYDLSFTGWEPILSTGGSRQWLGPVKAISVADKTLDVYAVGTNPVLYHTRLQLVFQSRNIGGVVQQGWFPVWQDRWDNLGGQIVGTPAVATSGNGREEIFVKGTDNKLYQKVFDGNTWFPSQDGYNFLGGPIDGSPIAASMQADWMTLLANGPAYYSGTRDLVYKAWFNTGHWFPSDTAWINPGQLATNPDQSSPTPPSYWGPLPLPWGASGVPTLLAVPGVGVRAFSVGCNYQLSYNFYSPSGPSDLGGWGQSFGSIGGVLSW